MDGGGVSSDQVLRSEDEQGGIKEVPVGGATPVLSEARTRDLSVAAAKLVKVFAGRGPLDIEWVLEGETIWSLQARTFIDGAC